MAIRVGVYDSGIGGLTTLALLRAALPRCDFLYLADNARMPFGTKSKEEISVAVHSAMKRLSADCDLVVMGCNTASVTVNPEGAFTLRPDIEHSDPAETLVLGTPLTLAGLQAKEKGFSTADTGELAVLVEIRTSLSFKSKTRLGVPELSDYLELRLSPFKGIKKVLLGCSHYVYAASLIHDVLGGAVAEDGNDKTVGAVCRALYGKTPISTDVDVPSELPHDNVKFEFTGINEKAKYRWVLAQLQNTYARNDENLQKVRKAVFFPD